MDNGAICAQLTTHMDGVAMGDNCGDDCGNLRGVYGLRMAGAAKIDG
jgi:hypothetical protein